MTQREEEMLKHAIDYGEQHQNDLVNSDDSYLLSDAYCNGWIAADANNPEIAYLEHEIERLKSKLQAADDLNTLLTTELEKAKSPWISVNDRLPKESKKYKNCLSDTVFVVTNQGDGTSARYDHAIKTWCPAKILRGRITHWMSIPQKLNNY